MTKEMDSKWLPLATASILRQAPSGWLSGESVWMHGRMFGLLCLQRMNNYSFIEKIVRSIYAEGVN
jgi:hypothetical protein